MREIVFDTETTGLDPNGGDRVVEIGCVELINHIPSGKTFHVYVNPERSVPAEAVRVHGLDDARLRDKPPFSMIAREFLDFVGEDAMIAHNAEFDFAFINAELVRAGHPTIASSRMVDTLMLARRKHPAGPNSLDALCARYQSTPAAAAFTARFSTSELLAEVYVELIGGRQARLVLGEESDMPALAIAAHRPSVSERPVPRFFRVTADELTSTAPGSAVSVTRRSGSPTSPRPVSAKQPPAEPFLFAPAVVQPQPLVRVFADPSLDGRVNRAVHRVGVDPASAHPAAIRAAA